MENGLNGKNKKKSAVNYRTFFVINLLMFCRLSENQRAATISLILFFAEALAFSIASGPNPMPCA